MKKYNPEVFIKNITQKTLGGEIPNCQYCGGKKFTSTDKLASIFIGDDLDSVNLGPSIPAGMVICEKCGHVEFFALGALGMLTEEGGENGKKHN